MTTTGDTSSNPETPDDDREWAEYLAATPEERLLLLQASWKAANSDRQRAIFEGRALEASIGVGQHPEGFELGCLCDECCSSG